MDDIDSWLHKPPPVDQREKELRLLAQQQRPHSDPTVRFPKALLHNRAKVLPPVGVLKIPRRRQGPRWLIQHARSSASI